MILMAVSVLLLQLTLILPLSVSPGLTFCLLVNASSGGEAAQDGDKGVGVGPWDTTSR